MFKKCLDLNIIISSEEKILARVEVHIEVVVIAFAFIMEDFAELFIEYFCVEKYITGYEYELDYAQSYMAAISSISLNLIGKVEKYIFNLIFLLDFL